MCIRDRYVDANAGSGDSGGIDMSGQTVYTGSGTVRIVSESFNDSRYNAILNAQNKGGGYCGFAVNGRVARIGYGFNKEATSSPGTYVSVSDETVRIAAPSFVYNNNKVVTEANLADEQNLGVVKLTHTVSHGEHPNEAVTPDGVAAYVDSKLAETTVNTNIGVSMKSGPAGRPNVLKSVYTAYAVGGTVLFTCAFHMDELAGKNEALALFTFTGVSLADMQCRVMSASFDHATECTVAVSGNVVTVSSTEKESPQNGLNYFTILLPVKK